MLDDEGGIAELISCWKRIQLKSRETPTRDAAGFDAVATRYAAGGNGFRSLCKGLMFSTRTDKRFASVMRSMAALDPVFRSHK